MDKLVDRQKKFIIKVRRLYSHGFDFSQVNYLNMDTPVSVRCLLHGYFMVTPRQLLSRNSPCPECKDQSCKTNKTKLERKLSNEDLNNLINQVFIQSDLF